MVLREIDSTRRKRGWQVGKRSAVRDQPLSFDVDFETKMCKLSK